MRNAYQGGEDQTAIPAVLEYQVEPIDCESFEKLDPLGPLAEDQLQGQSNCTCTRLLVARSTQGVSVVVVASFVHGAHEQILHALETIIHVINYN
jgi:hypothetical protein